METCKSCGIEQGFGSMKYRKNRSQYPGNTDFEENVCALLVGSAFQKGMKVRLVGDLASSGLNAFLNKIGTLN